MLHLRCHRIIVFFALLTLLGGAASAKDQFLIRATNDQDTKVEELAIRVDKSGRLSHLLHSSSGRTQAAYTAQQLKNGVVLKKKSGRDLVSLKMQRFSPEKGASVVLTYLYSAVPMDSYQSIKLDLVKDKGEWVLKDSKGRRLSSLHIRANMANVLGYRQAVGIRQLELQSAD